MIPFLVALGGGLGAVARFMVDSAIARRNGTGFPLGTFTVNVTGSFVLMLLVVWGGRVVSDPLADLIYAAAGVGFLGGYTTFSTASVEGVRLISVGRWGAGIGHALGMLAACYAAALLALLLGATLWAE